MDKTSNNIGMKYIKKNKLLIKQLTVFIRNISPDYYYSNLYTKFGLENNLDINLSDEEVEDIKDFFSKHELFIKVRVRDGVNKKGSSIVYESFKKEKIKSALRLLKLMYIDYYE